MNYVFTSLFPQGFRHFFRRKKTPTVLADVTSYETASLVLVVVEVVVVLVVIIIRTAIGKLHDTIAKGKGAFLFSGKK